jgi:hypothetical protein
MQKENQTRGREPPAHEKGNKVKNKKSWLAVLAAAEALTFAQTGSAITFGEPDGNLHPNVGAVMITWPDLRYAYSSGTLVYKSQDGRTGVLLTAGHSTDAIETGIASGEIQPGQVTVTFNMDANNPDHDLPVVGIRTLLVERPSFSDWDDAGILVIQVEDPADLPEVAVLVPVGFLDQFNQKELHQSQLLEVGYGCTLLFPPPQTAYENKRQSSTPKYLNLVHTAVFLQANGPAGNSGVSWGDSGGPLFWRDPQTGAEFIVAIGRDANTHTFNSYARDYRVDTQVVQDFIRTVENAYP